MNGELLKKFDKKYIPLIIFLLAFFAVIRILNTYDEFWGTWDEPLHIAAGMEWIEKGTWTVDKQHPPLGRVAEAVLPYFNGLTYEGKEKGWDEAREILYRSDAYSQNLNLGRVAVIPFFLISIYIVWVWGRSYFGVIPALFAVTIYTTLHPVLAHSGFATTDIPGTAMIVTTLFLFCRFLDQPTIRRAFILAIFTGLAILTKYSALLFLPAGGGVILALRMYFADPQAPRLFSTTRDFGKIFGVCAFTIFLVVWGGFRFSLGPLTTPDYRPHHGIDKFIGTEGTMHDLVYEVVEGPYTPLASFYHGVHMLSARNDFGHGNFIMGEYRPKGVWFFFPMIFLVKSPLPFLVLTLIGIYLLAQKCWRDKTWILLAPIGAAIAMILISLPSNINIGVRHLLPTYPLFAIVAGYGAYRLWNFGAHRYIGPVLVSALLFWQITSSLYAHPNYLTYFNFLAGSHPEQVSGDSDFDWGQDLKRLSKVLKELHIQNLSLAYNGSADLRQHGFPHVTELIPHKKTTGWVAISSFRWQKEIDGGFDWLNSYKPVTIAGNSIRLYFIPDTSIAAVTDPPNYN